MRWPYLAVLLGSLVLVAAACDANEPTSPTTTPQVTATEGRPDNGAADPPLSGGIAQPPVGSIMIDGREFPLEFGTFCWAPEPGSPGFAACVDSAGVVTSFPYAEATAGATVALAGPLAGLDLTIELVRFSPAPAEPISEDSDWQSWQPAGETGTELVPADGTVTLPDGLEPGRYLIEFYVVRADASGHSATYGALIEIE
jgi:hypothetical protein